MTHTRVSLIPAVLALLCATNSIAQNVLSIQPSTVTVPETSRFVVRMKNDSPVNGLNVILEYNSNHIMPLGIRAIERAAAFAGSQGHAYGSGRISLVVYDNNGGLLPADSGDIVEVRYVARDSTYPFSIASAVRFVSGTVAGQHLDVLPFLYAHSSVLINPNAPPAPPSPASPVNGATNQPTLLSLAWHPLHIGDSLSEGDFSKGGPGTRISTEEQQAMFAVDEPKNERAIPDLETRVIQLRAASLVTYDVQLATDSAFSNLMGSDSLMADTSWQSAPLPILTRFFWRVRARSPHGTGPWSQAWHLTTDSVPSAVVRRNWQIVSNPVTRMPGSDSVRSIYPSSVFDYAFSFDQARGYHSERTLVNGRGYWIKSAHDDTVLIPGSPRLVDTIDIHIGWNMIGSISVPVDTTNAVSIPPGVLVTPFYGYGPGYAPASTILPGWGYWVKSLSDGRLVLRPYGGSFSPSAISRRAAEVRPHSLRFTDSKGQSQELLFATTVDDEALSTSHEMPPLPPEGAFDIRYGTGSQMAAVRPGASKTVPIEMVGASLPAVVSWHLTDNPIHAVLMVGNRPIEIAGEGTADIPGENTPVSLTIRGLLQVPEQFALHQNYPNPFNPSTKIDYDLPVDIKVTLTVYDLLGRKVETVLDEEQKAGYKSIIWKATRLASGAYFYRIQAGDFIQTRKMLLLK